MVIDHCTINIQTCMIPFCVRSNILIKMMYHTCLFVNCTTIYDHICNFNFRSILFALLQSYQNSVMLRRVKMNLETLVKVVFFETKCGLASHSQMVTLQQCKELSTNFALVRHPKLSLCLYCKIPIWRVVVWPIWVGPANSTLGQPTQ